MAVLVLAKLQALAEVGALVSELGEGMNVSAGTLLTSVHRLRDRGLIASHPHPSRYANNRMRWYAVEHRPALAPVVQLVEPGFKKKRTFVALDRDSQPVETSRVPVQVLPGYTHNHRAQCAPGEQPFGAGFAALGVGRYLESGARK